MKLTITRFKNIFDGTIGKFKLEDNGQILLEGYSLEPKGADTTEPNRDRRVPQGLYHVSWHQSVKFKRTLPLLYNEVVPKKRYILIHAGNFPKDTDGCILLGNRCDEKGVYQSAKTLEAFMSNVRGKLFEVEIINEGV